MPSNFAPRNASNPYADYSVEQLYDFMSNYKLSFRPGTHYEYANLGFGLLGHALALRAGMSYEDLVISRICAPAGHGEHPDHAFARHEGALGARAQHQF